MKRCSWVICCAVSVLFGAMSFVPFLSVQPAIAAPPGFVTRVGTRLALDGAPFRFTGLNIYQANSNGLCGDAMGGSVLDDSLAAIGPDKTVFRSWFFQQLATTGGTRDWSAFDRTLTSARAHGVKVIATLTDQWGNCGSSVPGGYKDASWYEGGYQQPDPVGIVSYRDFVSEIVSRYKDDPTILAWQLVNEPEVGKCDVVPESTAAADLKTFAADVSGLIKSIDPNHLVSLGTLGTGQCGARESDYQDVMSVPTLDLCEYHDYQFGSPMPGDKFNGLKARLDQCGTLGKPLIVGEVGIKPSDVGGTLAARADTLRSKLWAQFNAGVAGELAWAWNKDASTLNDYDIGPGDPALAVLGAGWAGTAPGALDPLFGGTGVVKLNVATGAGNTPLDEDVADSVVQPDGKVVVLATVDTGVFLDSGTGNGNDKDIELVRFNVDGSLDTTFGGGAGYAQVNLGAFDGATSVALDAAGGLVVAGYTETIDPVLGFYLVHPALFRLNADGSRDLTFAGGTGVVLLPDNAVFRSAAIDGAGRILAVSDAGNSNTFFVHRYFTDGVLDSSYGSGGVASVTAPASGVPFTSVYNNARKIVVDGAGRAAVVAQVINSSHFFPPPTQYALVARFDSSGAPEAGFGTNGVVQTAPTFSTDPRTIAFSGSDLVVGGGDGSPFLMRYDATGTLDPAFGTGGTVDPPVPNASVVVDLAVDVAGRVIATTDSLDPSGPWNVAAVLTGGRARQRVRDQRPRDDPVGWVVYLSRRSERRTRRKHRGRRYQQQRLSVPAR